jgi:hypothetical protein
MVNVVEELPGLGTGSGFVEKLAAAPLGSPETVRVKLSAGPGAKVSETVTVNVAVVSCGATWELGVTVTFTPPIRA